MKILHVPNAYFPVIGGAENNCRRFSEILAGQGHEVHVVTTDVGAVQAYDEFGIPRVERADEIIGGVAVTRLPFSTNLYKLGGVVREIRPTWVSTRLAGLMWPLLHRRLTDMVTTQIMRIRPDVVMTMPHLVANVKAVLTARQRVSFPLVMVPMLHEQDPNWNPAPMKEALRLADAVIALTLHEADRLVDAYAVAREKIFHASVGIDVAELGLVLAERPYRIVFLGRQARSKGMGDLIKAMEVVWGMIPGAELWIAGVRIPETAEVDDQIGALPESWRKQVINTGAVTEAEKCALLRSARCLVLPSRSESFGQVILEAWAHATPVVAWNLPVFRSIIENDRTGLLVDPSGGSRALGEAILQVLQHTEKAAQMGHSGRLKAASTYSWKSVASVYLDAYEYAVQHASAGRLV
jgi:glycogen synthase